MFRKRIKKQFPPGTFIPTSARIVSIIQLCIAFTLILWYCGQPFMGELFSIKSKMLVFQNIMGILPPPLSIADAELMKKHANWFDSLQKKQKEELLVDYQKLKARSETSFLQKLERMISILFFEIHPLAYAWIFFSIVISVFLLIKIEGAKEAAWILPLIATAYLLDHHLYGKTIRSADEELFPTEHVIINDYLKEPLSTDILTQHTQLTKGWKLYLIKEWAKELPSDQSEKFQEQLEKGQFAFTVARAEKLRENKEPSLFSQKEPIGLLLLYVLWNFFFAYFVNKHLRQESKPAFVN